MRISGLAVLLVFVVTLPAMAAKHATSSGQVAHSRRAPVAMHRMFPPYAGNHVYEKPPTEGRSDRGTPNDRESNRRTRSDVQR